MDTSSDLSYDPRPEYDISVSIGCNDLDRIIKIREFSVHSEKRASAAEEWGSRKLPDGDHAKAYPFLWRILSFALMKKSIHTIFYDQRGA